jgi:beta-ribofuranosylaminobenzene 5'-phosphate synthase
MIRVRTPSRLHFGLLSLPSEHSPTGRHFGGVGLMIDKPGIELRVEPSEQFFAGGPLAERALQYARTYCERVGIPGAFRVHIASAAPEHMGLGTGTQLGLAVARAIAELTKQPQRDAVALAPLVDRGRRSAIGVHGFEQGGFLVEAGKVNDDSISPLVVQHSFPQDWRVHLIFPHDGQGTHGSDELGAFASLLHKACDERATEVMSRLVLLHLLPALFEADLEGFGDALHEYNRRAGEMFQSVQGGIYANAWIEATIKVLRDMGIKGVGQSSWGPVVFAIVSNEQTNDISNLLVRGEHIDPSQLLVTSACNHGAVISA